MNNDETEESKRQTEYLGRLATLRHINDVRELLLRAMMELDVRACNHDASKLEEPEASLFAKYTPLLSSTVYNSPEYHALRAQLKPALDHHYANNRHHPEHWPNGVEDMTLIDLLEMLCDWKASSSRNKNGNLRRSVDESAERFAFSPQLTQIFHNTVRELFPK